MTSAANTTTGSQTPRLSNPLPPPFVSDYRPYAVAAATARPVGLTPHADCRGSWDSYYRHNTLNGYKDRHYILREFLELRDAIAAADPESSRRILLLTAAPIEGEGDDDDGGEAGGDEAAASGSADTAKLARAERQPLAAATPAPVAASDVGGAQVSTSTAGRPTPTVGLIEIGCGVGNTILPLLVQHACLRGIACDISGVAVGLLQKQACTLGVDRRCASAVVDIAEERVPRSLLQPTTQPPPPVTGGGGGSTSSSSGGGENGVVDFATLIFVLCSVPVPRMAYAVETVAQTLAPGTGVLFWRDYADGDLAMTRFGAAGRRAGNDEADTQTFARSNGTLSHFFSRDEIERLFAPWFETVELKRVERTVVNRRCGTEMPRLWWQGRFRRREQPLPGTDTS